MGCELNSNNIYGGENKFRRPPDLDRGYRLPVVSIAGNISLIAGSQFNGVHMISGASGAVSITLPPVNQCIGNTYRILLGQSISTTVAPTTTDAIFPGAQTVPQTASNSGDAIVLVGSSVGWLTESKVGSWA